MIANTRLLTVLVAIIVHVSSQMGWSAAVTAERGWQHWHLAGLVFPACGAPRVGEGAGTLNTLRVALPDGHG